MPLTVTQRNAISDAIFRGTAPTVYASKYLSLHTANPTDSGASEVAGGSYARQAVSFDAAAAGHTQNTGAVTFAGMPSTTVTHWAVWSAVTGGVLLGYDALTASKSPSAGDSINFAIGELDWEVT